MFSQLLSHHGFPTTPSSPNPDEKDHAAPAGNSPPALVIISVVAASTLRQLHPFCLRLRALQPTPRIVVGLWGATGDLAEPARRTRESGADALVTSFADALATVGRLTAPPTLGPNDERRRG
jgi:hypothetical protein